MLKHSVRGSTRAASVGRVHALRGSPAVGGPSSRGSAGPFVISRGMAATAYDASEHDKLLPRLRNIGISAHIDSGKTTLTERVLFYTGRIDSIHEVRGKDGVGATMDSMELEREKGITIQSAATFCQWGENRINIIDTPGHVDFTVEVERALRVLDGAVLLLCGVGGVQSQSITVDRQMKRYNVPRLCFINKLDRMGANPWRVIDDLRSKLRLNAAAVQVPIGLEERLEGVVDLVHRRALYNVGEFGEKIEERDVPEHMAEEVEERRHEMVERLAEVDEEVMELFLMEEEIPEELITQAIRRQVHALQFVPVYMGSAFKNRGVQPLLDAVCAYLPSPNEVPHTGLDVNNDEVEVPLTSKATDPMVALAFKLEEGKFGQLTFMRVYQGSLRRGATIYNVKDNKKIKVRRNSVPTPQPPRPVRRIRAAAPRARRSRALCACTRTRWRTWRAWARARLPPCSGWTAPAATPSPTAPRGWP